MVMYDDVICEITFYLRKNPIFRAQGWSMNLFILGFTRLVFLRVL